VCGETMGTTRMSIFRRSLLILALCLTFLQPFSSGEIYRWTDEEGTIHMTENSSAIPPQYRDQTQKRSLSSDPVVKETASAYQQGNSAQGLKHFELPYQGFEGSARRIIIPATLNDSVTTNLLLDTGAPGLVISHSLAERLGLVNFEEGGLMIMTGGIGGPVPAMLTTIDSIRIGEAIAEFLPATITKMPSNHFEGLVGMDFLANYRISIDTGKHVITFDELPAQQDKPGGYDELWWRSNFHNISTLKRFWHKYLIELENTARSAQEAEKLGKMAKHQYAEAEKLYDKLERFANNSAVPSQWKQ